MADSRKRPDIGEGIIKVCILGILSSLPRGCSANRILRGLPRTQSPERLKIFLNDLKDRGLVEKTDLSDFRQNLEGYKITGDGMKFLDKYFNIEFKETRDIVESISEVNYLHLKEFWEKHGRQY